MIITCIGHAEFLLELDNGMRIVTDPYDASCGYPILPTQADAVLVSHGHHDHSAIENVQGATTVIDKPGQHTLSPDVRVTAVPCFHDDAEGAKRGANLMVLIEADGLRIAHLGDLGHLPTKEQIAALAPIDLLMLPVGGFFTIGPEEAKQAAQMLQAQVILPMHYRTAANADWPIAPVEEFTKLYPTAEEVDLLRVTANDMDCQPTVAILKPKSMQKGNL